MSDLDLVPTDDLVDVLERRFPSLVLITLATAKGKADEEGEEMCSWYRGGWNACYGLVRRMASRMEMEDAKRFEHVSGDDEDSESESEE